MKFLFVSLLLCIAILFGSAEARSKKPRPADFDDIARLILEDSNAERQKLAHTHDLRWLDEKASACGYHLKASFKVDWASGIIESEHCGAAGMDFSSKAYINELDFSKAFIESKTWVSIPCIANRDCNWGPSSRKITGAKNSFVIKVNSEFVANEILELLKPN